MKIEGPRPTGAPSPTRRPGAGATAGFSVPPAGEAAKTVPVSPATPASALSAVLALQAEGYDPERRRRQVRRGQKTLDALEALTRAHLDGEVPHAARLRLVALQGEMEPTGDPALDAVLAEIDVRAAVELAKLDASQAQ